MAIYRSYGFTYLRFIDEIESTSVSRTRVTVTHIKGLVDNVTERRRDSRNIDNAHRPSSCLRHLERSTDRTKARAPSGGATYWISRLPEIYVPSSSQSRCSSTQLAACSRKSTDHFGSNARTSSGHPAKQSIVREHRSAPHLCAGEREAAVRLEKRGQSMSITA